jgi:cysteine-S-conjugate beta-lyase
MPDPHPLLELDVDPLPVLRQRRSAKWRTYPHDVLPLTVAEMDYPLAPFIANQLRDAVNRSDTGYAYAAPDLGVALAGFSARRWSWQIDPAQVTAVTDVGVGVSELLRVVTAGGGSVVISPPVYPPFFDWIAESGARLIEAPLRRGEHGWALDLDLIEREFTAGAVAYVLCNPHNPVGRVHTPQELAGLVELAHRYGVVVISDEIHAPLALPGATFTPLLTVPGAAEVAISVLSASKAWNLAALKCACIVTADPAMASIVAELPPDTRWRVGHFGVIAAVAAWTDGEPWLDLLLRTLDARRTQLGMLLHTALPEITWSPPQATYLAWLDCTALGEADVPRDVFLDEGRVALEPGLRFGKSGGGFVRLNFATSGAILAAAVDAMANAAAEQRRARP